MHAPGHRPNDDVEIIEDPMDLPDRVILSRVRGGRSQLRALASTMTGRRSLDQGGAELSPPLSAEHLRAARDVRRDIFSTLDRMQTAHLRRAVRRGDLPEGGVAHVEPLRRDEIPALRPVAPRRSVRRPASSGSTVTRPMQLG